jgi:hypothetical protein
MMHAAAAAAGSGNHPCGSRDYSDACSSLPDNQHAAHASLFLPAQLRDWNAPQLQQPQLVLPQQQQQQQQPPPKQKLPAHLAAKRFCLDLSDEALGSTAAAAAHGSS